MTDHITQIAPSTPTPRYQARMAAARRKRLRRYAADSLLASHVLILLVMVKVFGEDPALILAGALFPVTLAVHVWLTSAAPIRPEATGDSAKAEG